MSIHLSRDIKAIHTEILSMCAEVESMVHRAVDEVFHPIPETAYSLVEQDDEIDRRDVRIEEECLKMLALHQPVAVDLRRITTVLKISSELERVADISVHIAERACSILPHTDIIIPDKMKYMSKRAVDMLHRSIDAYVELDSDLARKVCSEDDEVDFLNREIIIGLIEDMKKNPELVEPLMHLFSVSRHIERVADHATNIAENVVYLVEGEIIRHEEHLHKR